MARKGIDSMNVREQLRAEIERTRERFHELLDRVPGAAFDQASRNPAWTIGQVLYHMSLAPRFVIADVHLIVRRPWLFRWIPRLVPRALFDWLNARWTRYGARRLSHAFLAHEYDGAHAVALRALESVRDEEFQRSVPYPGWDPLLAGEVTLERLFHYVRDHFEVHAAEIEQALAARKHA
jgi:hypothetical protein